MSPVLAIALLWAGFAGSHMILSSLPVRRVIIAGIGEGPFRGIYSLVAFAFFVPLVWVYFANKHAGPLLWTPPLGPALRWVVYLGMAVAFVLLVASFVQPSPASVGASGAATPKGILRITRHPLLMGLLVFGLAHLLVNANAADVAFFGGFVLFPIVGAWHQDQRKLATMPEYAGFHRQTPFLPFSGGNVLPAVRELPGTAVVVALGLTVLVRYFHGWLFGG